MKTLLICLLPLGFFCNDHPGPVSTGNADLPNTENVTDDNPYAFVKNIPLPAGFKRPFADPNSFAFYLKNIALKKDKTVYLYNNQPKFNQLAQYAVLNISVGDKDLQQCADAVMRLRAEYLFETNYFDRIVFYDNGRAAYKFSAPYTREHFLKYLDKVFGMCGSASLAKQLNRVADLAMIQPGDVFIRGGFPGHAVIVMDVAMNAAREKIYLLAQSYMPAQDIHVLKNTMNEELSPWYEVNENKLIRTPEYNFSRDELKRW